MDCLRYIYETSEYVLKQEYHNEQLYSLNPPKNDVFIAAAYGGNIEIIKYLCQHKNVPLPHNIIATIAAREGHLHILEYLIPDAFSINHLTYAVKYGHLDCAQYMVEKKPKLLHVEPINVAPWLNGVDGPYPMGNPVEIGGFQQIMECDNVPHLMEGDNEVAIDNAKIDRLCISAVQYGRLECLKWLRHFDEKSILSPNLVELAIRNGSVNGNANLECVEYLFQHGYKCTIRDCCAATEIGNLDILMFLLGKNCPCDGTVAETAAQYGQIDILIYLNQHNRTIDRRAIAAAIKGYHHECLQYLKSINITDK
jgi:hypothetical protein